MSYSFETPWTVACQAPLPVEFPRQEYWSELSFPSPGNLSNPGIKPTSPELQGGFFTAEPPGKPPKDLWIFKCAPEREESLFDENLCL